MFKLSLSLFLLLDWTVVSLLTIQMFLYSRPDQDSAERSFAQISSKRCKKSLRPFDNNIMAACTNLNKHFPLYSLAHLAKKIIKIKILKRTRNRPRIQPGSKIAAAATCCLSRLAAPSLPSSGKKKRGRLGFLQPAER